MSFFSVSNVQIAGLSACVPVMKDDILSVYSKWGMQKHSLHLLE